MAEASNFDESNTVFGPPKGRSERDVFSINAHVDQVDGQRWVTTCWRLSAEELEEINRTGRVWVRMVGGLAPHRVDGIKPF